MKALYKSKNSKLLIISLACALAIIMLFNLFLGMQSNKKDNDNFSVEQINYLENESIDYDNVSTKEKRKP